MLQYTGADVGGNITEDISALAADQPNVRIRWHYYDAYRDYYWGIDSVKVIGNYRISAIQMAMEGDGGSGFGGYGFSGFGFTGLKNDELIIPSVAESLRTRPERLRAKSQKFYDINPFTTITAKQQGLVDPISIKEILEWLEEVWLSGELDEALTETEYLEFRKAIEESF